MPLLNRPDILQFSRQYGFCIYLWSLTEDEEELARYLPASFHYGSEAKRLFHSSKRRREWLAARVLLSTAANINDRICYDDYGRPYLHAANTHIGISHSADIVCLALSSQVIGIDVEAISDKAFRMKSKFLSPGEELVFQSQLETAPLETATVLWSAKEAVFKQGSGKHLHYITQISLQPTSQYGTLKAIVHDTGGQSINETEVAYWVFSDFVITKC